MTSEENQFILDTFHEPLKKDIWIGGLWLGAFVWSDGSPWGYINWAAGEPNKIGVQNCVMLWSDHDGKWDNNYCSDTASPSPLDYTVPAFLCKKCM